MGAEDQISRAWEYIRTAEPAIEGSEGSKRAMSVAWNLVQRFGLSVDEALPLMRDWSATCQPPWSEKELIHKLNDAKNKSTNPVTHKVTGNYTILAEYIYRDPNGNEVFRKKRFATEAKLKNFLIEPKGAIAKAPYLYNLPAVYKAKKTGETVLLVEGEKDADTGTRLGFVSTTDPCGAGGWNPGFAGQLKDNHVAIIADRDETGYKGAIKRCQLLFKWAKSVKIITLPGSGKDLTDWVNEHTALDHTAIIKDLIEKTPDFNQTALNEYRAKVFPEKPQGLPMFEPEEEPQTAQLPEVTSFLDFKDDPFMKIDYLIDGLLAREDLFIFNGKAKSGKSTSLMNMAVSLATGIPFVGRRCQRVNVLYVAMEDKDSTVKNRVKTLCDRLGVNPGRNLSFVFRDSLIKNSKETAYLDAIKMILAKNKEEAENGNPMLKYTVVFLDPMYYLGSSIDENSSKEMGKMIRSIRQLGLTFGLTVVLSTHAKKGSIVDLSAVESTAGSSQVSRIGEAYVSLAPHEKDGYSIARFTLRDGKTPANEVWSLVDYPVLKLAPDEDPEAYRAVKEKAGRPAKSENISDTILKIIGENGGSYKAFDLKLEVCRRTGVKESTFQHAMADLTSAKKLYYNTKARTYEDLSFSQL